MGRGLVSLRPDEQSPSSVGHVLRALQPNLHTLPSGTCRHCEIPPPAFSVPGSQSHLSARLSSEMCQSCNHLWGPPVHYVLVYQSEHHD